MGGLKLAGGIFSTFPGKCWNKELAISSDQDMQMTPNFHTNKISMKRTCFEVYKKFWRLSVTLRSVTSHWHLPEMAPVKNKPYFLQKWSKSLEIFTEGRYWYKNHFLKFLRNSDVLTSYYSSWPHFGTCGRHHLWIWGAKKSLISFFSKFS